ncbi:S53 family peptidase [Aspergillus alliaceus]|uniref:S53 family peptidase n=1 Tax=Petromyces alliaceus TaxID=209559 RepID=UPI0012A71D4D|nr:peptidase S8/S53 domain-containing protein [Aspergillus alliaceus]KAB8236499.1 peptidase S8/S53 domain-containing protein [Aspergillus alliaceus]
MALVDYLGEFNNRSDIVRFLGTYRPDAVAAAKTFQDISVAGDAETMLGIAYPIPLTTYSVAGPDPPFLPDSYTPANTNEPFLTWLNWILDKPDAELPSVVSTSYGDIEQTVPASYAQRICRAFSQLGARGVSVIVGAGDHGIGHPGDRVSNDGLENPQFHKQAAHSYLSHIGNLHSGMFEPRRRAYPDVAVQGYRFVTVWNGETRLVDGTSASTQTFATIVALANDALIANDKLKAVFLNPWLYAGGYKAFRDVSVGSNTGCNTTAFPATAGWDAASGWARRGFLSSRLWP